jgi:hypothetical protein
MSGERFVKLWAEVTPGPRPGVAYLADHRSLPALAVELDPETIVIACPPFPQGPAMFVWFLQELARVAAHTANQVAIRLNAGERFGCVGSGEPNRHHLTDESDTAESGTWP